MAKHAERRQGVIAANDEGLGEAHNLLMSLPRVRMLRRTNRGGGTTIYYTWDGRSAGHGERMLGKDPEKALEKYRQHEAGDVSKRQVVRAARRMFNYSPEHANLPAWAKTMFHNAKHRARALGRDFDLTSAQFVALVAAADGHCQLSGVALDTSNPTDSRSSPFTPSIDRIDSTKGYVDGNCRIVCLMANMMLAGWGDAALLRFAEGVCRKAGLVCETSLANDAKEQRKKPLKSRA